MNSVKDSSKENAQYASQQKFHSGIKSMAPKWSINLRTRKLKYRTMGKRFVPEEKGVDVLLVEDAIKKALTKEVETIIILSGDADFVPLVEFIKTLTVETINLHLYEGSSTELRQACDKHILISFTGSSLLLK